MGKIKTVELFAGVGGFRLGLEAASERFQTVWANQWEPSMSEQYAYDCYISHFGENNHYICKDIALAKASIPSHDLLVGGFPCQDYSIAKKHSAGIEGPKGILWWQINDILQEKRPQYVLLENVDRLIRSPSKQRGRDFSIILRCLYEKGYAVEWRIINAADYGQGQRRRRTFILAYHNDTALFKTFADNVCVQGLKAFHHHIMTEGVFSHAFPVVSHSRAYTESWIDELEFQNLSTLSAQQRTTFYSSGVMMNGRIYSIEVQPCIEPCIPLRDILVSEPIDERFFLREDDMSRWLYVKGAKHELRRRRDGNPYYFSEGPIAFPEPLDKPSRTILTSEGQLNRSTHVVQDPYSGRLRLLTPMECERLNGFPDDWTKTSMPERMRYFMMGNALVIPIVTKIGQALLDLF